MYVQLYAHSDSQSCIYCTITLFCVFITYQFIIINYAMYVSPY